MRARIDVSEIEAQTKIRAKYLRALENEEWDLLPGPTFVKSFLRTYGQALDLDGKALVEEYRQNYERPNETALEPIVSPSSRAQGSGRRGGGSRGGAGRRTPAGRSTGAPGPSRGYLIAIGGVSVLILILVVALLSGGSSSNNPTKTASSKTKGVSTHHTAGTVAPVPTSQTSIVALSIQPTATVYVCLISASGRKLIPGTTLEPGATLPTFHSHRFLLTLGNNAVKLYIDGSLRVVPASSKPIGYSITKAGGRHILPASQQPTCH
jgi:cytoskeleton protein RodZ